jgi:hypothetical protein
LTFATCDNFIFGKIREDWAYVQHLLCITQFSGLVAAVVINKVSGSGNRAYLVKRKRI